MTRNSSRRLFAALAACLAVQGHVAALEPRKQELVPLGPGEPLAARAFYRPELSVSLGHEAHPVSEALAAVVGPNARLFVDPRSGAPTNVVAAVPMIPGSGTGNGLTLESVGTVLGRPVTAVDAPAVSELVRGFVVRNSPALRVDAAE